MLFSRLLFTSLGLALLVIAIGAWVRLTGAGLGCPDWPGCYGHLTLPTTADEIEAAQMLDPQGSYDPGKALREMVHRYLAGALGLLVLGLTVLCAVNRGDNRLTRMMFGLLALIGMQALLGAWTVTLQLKPLIVTAHLLGGFATLGLLWWIWMRHRDWPAPTISVPRRLRWLCLAALVALIAQITLGGWVSTHYAALACPDFPTCRGQWWPDGMNFADGFVLWHGLGINYEFGILDSPSRTAIHMTHRLGAVFATILLLAMAIWSLRSRIPVLRRCALTQLHLLALQIALGISNVVMHLPLSVAVAHNVTAAILLLAVLTQLRLLYRVPASP